MRLAIDIRLLYHLRGRGLGAALMMTLEGLRLNSHKNEYWLLVDNFSFYNLTQEVLSKYFPQFLDVLKDERFHIHIVPEFSSVINSYEFTWEQLRLRRLKLPDQTLYWGFNYFFPVFANIPSAVHAPDTFAKVLPQLHSREDKRILEWTRVCAREAGLITAVSENTKKDIMRFYHIPSSRIAVVHEPVNDIYRPLSEEEKTEARQSFGLPQHYLLYVGVIEPRKNIINALRALDIINRERSSPIHFIIVGETGYFHGKPYQAFYDEIIRLGLRKHVLVTGFMKLDQLLHVYNCADAFLFPSLYEGFGIPPVEAMRCGVPTVVSNVSSLPEVTDGAAILVDPHSPRNIADGALKALTDFALREQMIAKGLVVANRYSLENRTARFLSILESYYHQLFGK
jgi:glycosyltransferase involved in cell wall biosynthesis